MKERPILFSGPMVRALLCGTKTQTRRVVGIEVTPFNGSKVTRSRALSSINNEMREAHNDDPDAATRLAIFRAAVEIGKAMP